MTDDKVITTKHLEEGQQIIASEYSEVPYSRGPGAKPLYTRLWNVSKVIEHAICLNDHHWFPKDIFDRFHVVHGIVTQENIDRMFDTSQDKVAELMKERKDLEEIIQVLVYESDGEVCVAIREGYNLLNAVKNPELLLKIAKAKKYG